MVKRYEKIIHAGYWLWFLFAPLLYWYLSREPVVVLKLFRPLVLSQLFIGGVTFYFQYLFVMPKLFKSKRQLVAVFSWSLVSLLFYILLRYALEEMLYPQFFGFRNYNPATPLTYYFLDNIYFGGRYIIASSLIWLVANNAKMIEERNALQKQQAEAEINFLRAQINPHFLFNTINNIYSLVYHGSDKSLPAIQKLGELMRYMTTELAKEKVELDKEIEYLKSSIELNELRYPGGGAVQMNIEGDTGRKVIAPFLLLPFVENAFKHGVADQKKDPIQIQLHIDQELLIYTCQNKISTPNKNIESTGTGLANLRQRLHLLYPQAHRLITGRQGDYFTAELEILLS